MVDFAHELHATRGPTEKKLSLAMPGEHNASNAAAAIAVLDSVAAEGTALDRTAALNAITSFPGLAHRLQLVHRWQATPVRSISFYNDSKATSPDASITALHAFDPCTALFIVGGYDKHIDASAFEALLAQRAAGVLGIGQTGRQMVTNIAAAGANLTHYAGTLPEADPRRAMILENPRITAIVLSPASASWDQYPNYEVRGDHFTSLARTRFPSPP